MCASVDKQMAENLAQDMADLMSDFDVVSRWGPVLNGNYCDKLNLWDVCHV